jgi:hypothetical protein
MLAARPLRVDGGFLRRLFVVESVKLAPGGGKVETTAVCWERFHLRLQLLFVRFVW